MGRRAHLPAHRLMPAWRWHRRTSLRELTVFGAEARQLFCESFHVSVKFPRETCKKCRKIGDRVRRSRQCSRRYCSVVKRTAHRVTRTVEIRNPHLRVLNIESEAVPAERVGAAPRLPPPAMNPGRTETRRGHAPAPNPKSSPLQSVKTPVASRRCQCVNPYIT